MTATLTIHNRMAVDPMIVARALADWLRMPVTTSLDEQERAVFTTGASTAELDAAAYALMPHGGWDVGA